MALDFFGFDRQFKSADQLASSEYAALTVGSAVTLCQNVNASYQQEVKPIYEVGNASVFFVPGHASGTISFGRLAGAAGFFAGLRDTQCGKINTVSINSTPGGCFAAAGALNFDGAVLQSVALTISTGAIEISESANIIVASMS